MNNKQSKEMSTEKIINEEKNRFYLVGEVKSLDEYKEWTFQGIYRNHDKALEKCIDERFFIAGVKADFDEPTEHQDFDFCYYPKTQTKPIHEFY